MNSFFFKLKIQDVFQGIEATHVHVSKELDVFHEKRVFHPKQMEIEKADGLKKKSRTLSNSKSIKETSFLTVYVFI